jgi:excisionase family DNA binding protein
MTNENAVPKLLVSKSEAAEALSVSVRSVENYLRAKLLPHKKIGKRTLIPFAALEAFARADHPSPVGTSRQ